MFTMDDLFDIAIKMEKNGEAVYVDSITKLSQRNIKEMLQWMADEEAAHRKWFRDQKNKLSLEIDETNLKQMVPDVISQVMGEKTLSLNEIDFSKIENIADLLQTCIGFEEETIMFYEMLGMFIDDEHVLKGLKQIILEEKKHASKLHDMIDSLS